jgi:DNA-binding transcriptional ArsR family regulator
MESLVQSYTKKTTILFAIDQNANRVEIYEYLFDKLSFHELIRYIWMGGFPRWRDNVRPNYVLSMGKVIDQSTNSFFYDLVFK